MTDASNLSSIYEKLGAMSSDIRTIKHDLANVSQKVEPISASVVIQVEHGRKIGDHETRLTSLEATELRRQGAVGLVEWCSKYWPFTILIAVAVAAWTFFDGKIGV